MKNQSYYKLKQEKLEIYHVNSTKEIKVIKKERNSLSKS